MKRLIPLFAILALALTGNAALAEPFKIDPSHTFVRFKISHIGFSWIYGRFNEIDGDFTYDAENPSNTSARFTIDMASLDTNHAQRDKHLRGEEFFAVEEYPTATFVSTDYRKTGENAGVLEGRLTIKGATHPATFQVTEMGAREDPWGDFRRSFTAKTEVRLTDYNIDYDLGPVETATIMVSVEGVRGTGEYVPPW